MSGCGFSYPPPPEAASFAASAEPAKPKATRNAKGGAQVATGTPAKAKATKKTTPTKKAPKGAKGAKQAKAGAREGSKTAQVVAMLQRKDGATLVEIMQKMGWQRHTSANR